MGCDSHSSQIEAVGVPTGLNCDVGMSAFVRVSFAGFIEQVEVLIGELNQSSSQCCGEVRCSESMLGIGCLVESLRIVQDREEGDDFEICSRLATDM